MLFRCATTHSTFRNELHALQCPLLSTCCTACLCNGRSNICSANGTCTECMFNTAGDYCELCAPGFYNDTSENPSGTCVACQCDTLGSIRPICDRDSGQCRCHVGVNSTLRQCNQCVDEFFALSMSGCRGKSK